MSTSFPKPDSRPSSATKEQRCTYRHPQHRTPAAQTCPLYRILLYLNPRIYIRKQKRQARPPLYRRRRDGIHRRTPVLPPGQLLQALRRICRKGLRRRQCPWGQAQVRTPSRVFHRPPCRRCRFRRQVGPRLEGQVHRRIYFP